MQALILAAGMGRRLGKATKDNTKCMVEVNGERLIDRFIKQLITFNLSRIIIVTGYKGEKLKKYILDNYPNVKKFEFVHNPIFDKTNNIYSLSLAKDWLSEDDTILLESDLIFEDSILEMLVNHHEPNLALVAKYESWMDGTMVRINADNEIINFIPKEAFRYEDIDVYYKTVNIYKFSKEFCRDEYVPFLEAYTKVMGSNEYYEQVLRVITLLKSSSLKALPLNGQKWYEIDDVQDLDIASVIFASHEERFDKLQKRYGGYWRFFGLMDFCYLVNPFFPPQRLLDEMKSNFSELLTNYPSGMNVNSLLAAKYFGIDQEYVVVGNGAAELIKTYLEKIHRGKIGIIYPTFEEYPNRLSQEDIVPFVVNDRDYRYSAGDIMDYYTNHTITTLLLINPDNPSGNYIPMKDLENLLQWASEKGIKLIIDESFVDFSCDFENNSLLRNDILQKYDNLIVIKSISKSYGVPGLRLGILASSDSDIISMIKRDVSIWNINSFGEYYMQIYGKYDKAYKDACARFIQEREIFYEKLKSIRYLHVMPSQANYFMCRVVDKYSSRELAELLIRKDILISDLNRKKFLEGQNVIRIAIRSPRENEKLLQALESLDS